MTDRSYLGEFEQIVLLAVLHLDEEGYGMTVRRLIEERAGRSASAGAVYATLDRLEEKGYVRSWEGTPTPERGGRARRHFGLTPEGSRALARTREMMQRMWEGAELDARPEGA